MAPTKRLAKICGLVLMGLIALVLAAPPAHAEERTISFTWDGDVPPGATLPEALTGIDEGKTKLFGEDVFRYKPGQRIGTDDGYYEFSGWSCDCEDASYDASYNIWAIEVGDHDEILTGTWTFHQRYTVSFTWDGDAPPDAVLPAASSGYQGGLYSLGPTTEGHYPVGHRITAEDGYYEFLGWSSNSVNWDEGPILCVEIGDHDVVVTGTWAFRQRYTVSFTWDGDVPPDAVLPAASSGYQGGLYSLGPTTEGHYPVGHRITAEDGYYEFLGWSSNSVNWDEGPILCVEIGDHDVVVTGTWAFHANETVPPADKDETVPPTDEDEQTPPAPAAPTAPSIPKTDDASASTATLAATTAAGLAALGIGLGMLQSKRKA